MWHKKKGKRTFRMTTVELVLITSSQLIRLENCMPLKQHRCYWQCTNPNWCKRKWIRKQISYIYGGSPVARSVSKAMPTCLLQINKERWQPTQWQGGGGNSPKSAKWRRRNKKTNIKQHIQFPLWPRICLTGHLKCIWNQNSIIKKKRWKMQPLQRLSALIGELCSGHQFLVSKRMSLLQLLLSEAVQCLLAGQSWVHLSLAGVALGTESRPWGHMFGEPLFSKQTSFSLPSWHFWVCSQQSAFPLDSPLGAAGSGLLLFRIITA